MRWSTDSPLLQRANAFFNVAASVGNTEARHVREQRRVQVLEQVAAAAAADVPAHEEEQAQQQHAHALVEHGRLHRAVRHGDGRGRKMAITARQLAQPLL